MATVLVAPDSFGGTLTPTAAAHAIATGWRRVRPEDTLRLLPLSDGGEGLLEVVRAHRGGTVHEREVVGPLGRPVRARWLACDGLAVVEMAEAAGLRLVPTAQRDPTVTTTYGVGQLIAAAADGGAARIVVGAGGSATVDGGAGALMALGLRLRRADGHGVKIGGGSLLELAHVDASALRRVSVEVWADVTTTLEEAAARFGPQKGADPAAVAQLTAALDRWAEVLETDLGVPPTLRQLPGTGAAGGLAYGLAAVLGAPVRPGAEAVAELVDLAAALRDADLVVTGEGRLDAASLEGKVVGTVLRHARPAGVPVAAVVGQAAEVPDALVAWVAAAPDGPGRDPAAEVAAAAATLAQRWSPVR